MKRWGWIIATGLLLSGLFWWLAHSNQQARAAVYWAALDPNVPLEQGVLSLDPDITVCFVGDAIAKREPRVRQIIEYIHDFETAANIRFVTTTGIPLQTAIDTTPSALTCPSPSVQPNGSDYYHGDIRVVIPGTELLPGSNLDWQSPIPGVGCETQSGSLSSDPEVASWNSNRLDLVWRGGWDNSLRQKNLRLENGKWRWEDSTRIDGFVSSGAALADLGVNNLHLFVRGNDGALWYRSGDGSTWGNWASLGGSLAADPASNPDAISISSNRLDVFVRWQDNTIRTISSTNGGASWGPWQNLGGAFSSSPTAASWAGNRMDVFARDPNDHLAHIFWNGVTWSPWDDLGGTLTSAPDAASWGVDRIDVFARTTNDNLARIIWNGSNWSTWENLGGTLTSGPTVVSRGANILDIFVRTRNGNLARRTMEDGATWGNWTAIGDNGGGGSWGNEPWLLDDYRACMFNLKLGDNGDADNVPWRNHTLHEFGHSLGLAHEHQRSDVNAGCTEDGYGGSISAGLLTPYDRDSVMHYAFASCNIPGNYGHAGLSKWDRLSLHIMYPEDNRVAEFTGTTVIQDSDILSLQSAWLTQGANIDVAGSNFQWHINGQTYNGPTLNIDLPIGEYTLEFTHQDFLGRDYSYIGKVRVLDVDDFIGEIVSPVLSGLPLLYPNTIYVPTVDLSLQPDQNVSFYLPSGIFDSSVVIYYEKYPTPPLPYGMQPVDMFFEVQASYLESGMPAQLISGQTYDVKINYQDLPIPTHIPESALGLYFWDGNDWQLEPTSYVNTETNEIIASPSHMSTWAVFAPHFIYLPHISR